MTVSFPRLTAAVLLAVCCASSRASAQTAATAQTTPRAQVQPPAAVQPAPAAVQPVEINAQQTREQLRSLLRQHPPALWEVLKLDPALLTDESYLAPYPGLTAFLQTHPDVVRNPRYYIGTTGVSYDDVNRSGARVMGDMFQVFAVLTGFLAVAGVVAWVIKTLVEYRRWLRLSKVQTDAHTRLVERLTSTEDLLAYVQSPAGQRFLQAGPAPVADPGRAIGAPYGRILWSVQAGTVVALVGAGLLFVSRRLVPDLADAAPFMFMLAILVLAIGVGFLLSSFVSYFVSRRLGLLESSPGSSHA